MTPLTERPHADLACQPHLLVADLHEKWALPVPEVGPAALTFASAGLGMRLVEEEFCELLEAFYGPEAAEHVRDAIAHATNAMDAGARDVVATADALGDLTVVGYGLARQARIPMPAVLAEIHRANLSKLGADGKPVYVDNPPGKIGKSDQYVPPNLRGVLARAAAEATGHPCAIKVK